MEGRVLIGCPVRNRGWVLPRYLRCLRDLDYPQELIQYAFVVNNSSDDTLRILQEFAGQVTSPVIIAIKDMDHPKSSERGAYNIRNLVTLRNILLSLFLASGCSHLFSVDSDILVSPESLPRLMCLNLPVVSFLVRNDLHLGDYGYYNICRLENGHYRPLTNFPRDYVIPVDCTGAGYLIQRWVIEDKGVRYHLHLQGEDAGFCDDARSKGIGLWCHTGIECRHLMKPETGDTKE